VAPAVLLAYARCDDALRSSAWNVGDCHTAGWIGFGPLAAYNVVFIGSYWTAGIGGWVLGRVLTGNSLAAFVGGLAFMCAPYRAAHLGHLQWLVACGWPLTFAAFHRATSHGGKWAFAAVACWLWQGLVSGHALVFLLVGIVIWLIWFAPRNTRLWIKVCAGIGAAAILVSPLFIRYRTAHAAGDYHRSYAEVIEWGANVTSLWQASRWLTVWGGVLPEGAGEEQLFPGIATLLLAALALAGVRRTHEASRPTVGYALIAVAAWILALGPEPALLGTRWYGPYWALFNWVPGFTELRVPSRFWMLGLVAFSALAALGTARVLETKRRTRALALVAILSAALIAEGWTTPFPLVEGPAPVPIPSNAAAVFEVPAGDPVRDATAMYRSLTHGRPVVNGWSGYVPPAYDRLVSSVEAGDASVLTELTAAGPLALVIDPLAPGPERYLRMATQLGAACSAHHDRLVCLIHAPRQASPTPATY